MSLTSVDVADRASAPSSNVATKVSARPLTGGGTGARRTLLALADQAVVSATSFLTTILIGRTCGPEQLGIYALGMSVVLFGLCTQESLIAAPYTAYIHRLQFAERASYAGSTLLQQGLLAGTALVGLGMLGILFAAGVGPAGMHSVTWALALAIPFMLMREFSRRLAFADLNILVALALDLAVAAVQLGGLAGLAYCHRLSPTNAYATLALASGVAGTAWLVMNRKRFALDRSRLSADLQRNWSFGRWVCASQLTAQGSEYLIQWTLAWALGAGSIGMFAACMTIVCFSNPLILGIGNVLSPAACRAFAEEGHAGACRVVSRTTMFLGVAMAVFCGAVALEGEWLMRVLYGDSYAGHQHTLTILAIALLVCALGTGADSGLRAIERPDMNLRANLLGLAVTLVAVLSLVGKWGLHGGAYGFLAGCVAKSAFRCQLFARLTRQVAAVT